MCSGTTQTIFGPISDRSQGKSDPDSRDNAQEVGAGENDVGEGESFDMKQYDGKNPRIYGTGQGVPVNITCSVEAHPNPHTFTWSLNSTTQEQVFLSLMSSFKYNLKLSMLNYILIFEKLFKYFIPIECRWYSSQI